MSSSDTIVWQVSELNQAVNDLLSDALETVWVEGEISNFVRAQSGHFYFSLKDPRAQVRCAMFRGSQRGLAFEPENGMQVQLLAQVGLYAPRGDFQLLAKQMRLSGEGAMQQAFEALKKRLEQEGLFAETQKQAIPEFPKRIGVVTSAKGAAIHDILSTLARRWPLAEVYLAPVQVQGPLAKREIAKAIADLNTTDCDVLIVGRGGGSLEDLWAFNEEIVARAIADSEIPIISGVGHEPDVTIADFVADLRAATPTAAAEHATPDSDEILEDILGYEETFIDRIRQILRDRMMQVDLLSGRLIHPQDKLQQQFQQCYQLTLRLKQAVEQRQQAWRMQLLGPTKTLEACSPLATLNRGYAYVTDTKGQVLSSTHSLKQGDRCETTLGDGKFMAEVLSVNSN